MSRKNKTWHPSQPRWRRTSNCCSSLKASEKWLEAHSNMSIYSCKMKDDVNRCLLWDILLSILLASMTICNFDIQKKT